MNGTADLLDVIAGFVGRFVAFPSAAALDAVTLWTAHAWVVDAFESTPRLALLSPERGSGKTRTLEVLELIVPNPVHSVNTTAAALFRLVREKTPSLLLDECDTYLAPRYAERHAEIQAFVNAGHRRGATAYRCVGDNPKSMRVEEFPAYAPVVLAGIGDLPETVLHRSVVIGMKRRAPHETVEPFRRRHVLPEAEEIARDLQAWATSVRDELANAAPTMPVGVVDRAADVWEALVAIGDLAGEPWTTRARAACVHLTSSSGRVPSQGEQLLADIRAVFTRDNIDKIHSEDLVDRLTKLDESPWADLHGRPLDKTGLSRRLHRFDVKSETFRVGDKVARGYRLEVLVDAFARYLPAAVPCVADVALSDGGTEDAEVLDLGAWSRDGLEPELAP